MLPFDWVMLGFFLVLGGCVGSFLNVVIWRLPHRGREVEYKGRKGPLTLSWPPSHCPRCDAPVQAYQNIPILSWLLLRGRCAGCRNPIALRYPLVELSVALVFAGIYLAYRVGGWQPFMVPVHHGEPSYQWPILLLHLFFAACLLAGSAIDADWYIIPLGIPWLIALVALLAGPFIDHPAIPTLDPQSSLALPVLGAAVGLVLANVLMWFKILPQSFSGEPGEEAPLPFSPPPPLSRKRPVVLAVAVVLGLTALAWKFWTPHAASLATLCAGLAVFLLGVMPKDPNPNDQTDEVVQETHDPHARREVLKELLFLLVPAALAGAAMLLPITLENTPIMARLLGILMGFLAGGAAIWLIRIFGTLGFGRVAMGLGDVHLMAGVGAVLGAKLACLSILLAVFLALGWVVLLLVLRKPNVLPFGPWLSLGSILAILIGNPLADWYLNRMLNPYAPPPPSHYYHTPGR